MGGERRAEGSGVTPRSAVGAQERGSRPGPGRALLVPGLVVLVVAAAVSFAGWSIHDRQARDLRREAAEALTGVRLLQSEQISRWFADQEDDARLLGSDAALGRLLRRQVGADADDSPPRAVTDLLAVFRRSNDVRSLAVVDTRLEVVAAAPLRTSRPDETALALAARALRSGKTVFADVYRTAHGPLALSLAAPISGAGSEGSPAMGVLIQTMDPLEVLLPLVETWPLASASGESILLSERDGRAVYVNELRLRPGGPMSFAVPLSETGLVGVKVVRGATGVHKGLDYRGTPVLASVGPVPGTPWYLVVKQDLAAIERPVRDQALTTAVLVASTVVIAGLVLLAYWRGREAASLRALVAAEKEWRLAETRYATIMREARESVVLLSADGRIVEANDYALTSYGYSRGDFVGRDGGLYRVSGGGPSWDERMQRLEADGGHLSFESVHRRSDGVEFPVEVSLSAASIEGELHCLEIARDIGERKAADAALRDSEARYRTLFEDSLSGFALHEIVLDEEGRPFDFVYLAANPAFEAQTGLAPADVLGRPASDVIPGLRETGLIERYGRVALTGEPERIEVFIPSLDRHFDIQAVSPRPGQFATLFIDISQRREAEEIIAGFFSSSPIGLFVVDRNLRYVHVNATLAELNGVAAEEHIGECVADVVPRLAAQVEPLLNHVVDTGEMLRDIEMGGPAAGPGGTPKHARVDLFPITDPDGLVRFVGGVVVDVTEAKEARRELDESRRFLERVLKVTPELIYIHDIVAQRNVFSNLAMAAVLGYSPAEILEMGSDVLPRILHPDDREVMAAHHQTARSLRDGDVLEVEYRMRRADGEWRVLRGRDSVFARNEDGAVTQLIGTAQDVTHQRRAEAALKETSQRLEATVMAAPIAVAAVDLHQVVTLWNPAAAGIFGWSAGEAVGRQAPFIPEDAAGQARRLMDRVIAGEQLAGVDLPCVRKDGSRLSTSSSIAALRGAGGEIEGVLLLVEDVSERRANALRLARLTHLYQVLSSVAEMIPRVRDPQRLFEELCRAVVEPGGFVMAWVGAADDEGMVRLLASAGADEGFAEAHRLDEGRPLTTLATIAVALVEGKTDTCPDVFADARLSEFAADAELRGFRACAAMPIGAGRRPQAALVIYSREAGAFDSEEVSLLERLAADVAFALEAAAREDARRHAERELAVLNVGLERRVVERTAELEAANAELEAFSYSVSHDLRAPLRALDGFSLALAEDCGSKLDGEALDFLRRIRAASQRMARLIDDLLMLSRVTRRELARETVDVSALAFRIFAELRAAEPDRDVEIAVEEGLSAEGDAHLLQIVFENLLSNAWKFTSRGAGGRVEVGSMKGDDGLVFFVEDDGAGFDGAYSDTMFAPFQRLHGAHEFPGTGIGLATVQRIVRRHGGRVWAEGETGRGATVYFTLGPGGEGG